MRRLTLATLSVGLGLTLTGCSNAGNTKIEVRILAERPLTTPVPWAERGEPRGQRFHGGRRHRRRLRDRDRDWYGIGCRLGDGLRRRQLGYSRNDEWIWQHGCRVRLWYKPGPTGPLRDGISDRQHVRRRDLDEWNSWPRFSKPSEPVIPPLPPARFHAAPPVRDLPGLPRVGARYSLASLTGSKPGGRLPRRPLSMLRSWRGLLW